MSGPYVITGVQTGVGADGSRPLRQEIDAWSADPANVDQVNLYLQALSQFQNISPTEKLSYFSIAGVHGEPFQPWDETTNANPRTQWRGYCTHASVLFPTWHRPYIAAFEQILCSIMNQIVSQYPDGELRRRYQTAASTFRIPYWDSAQLKDRGGRRSLNVPYLCTLPTIDVFTPQGITQTISNPLYSFKFPGGYTKGITSFQDQDGNFFPFASATGTSRYPPEYDQRDPQATAQWTQGWVDNDSVVQALQNLSSLGEDVYRSFTSSNYAWYSTTSQSNPPAPDSYQSLEAIHNEIHGITGGGGHMSWNTVSAFDPIFWLHHCNVDRLFAIWQAVYATNPNAWFGAAAVQIRDDRGTWSIAAGTYETSETPLAPFHKDQSNGIFSSNDIRDWTRFGSSYPELQPWLPKYRDQSGQFNPTLYRNDVVQQVTNLYSRVRPRVQRTQVPRNRLFAASQTGPQHGGPTTSLAAIPTTQAPQTHTSAQGQQFSPPPTLGQQFAPPPTLGQQFAPPPTLGQQFSAPPTTQSPQLGSQQFAPPPTQGQQAVASSTQPHFPPPPTSEQQHFSSPANVASPPTAVGQQFAPPPTGITGAAGPATHPGPTNQFTSAPPPVAKQSGLKGLMSSAQKHFGEALVAGREAAQGQHQQQPGAQQPAAKPTGASGFATKFGGIVGGGIHTVQERLNKKPQQGGQHQGQPGQFGQPGQPGQPGQFGQQGFGGPSGGSRGIDDEPGTEGELSRGFGDMNLGQGQGYQGAGQGVGQQHPMGQGQQQPLGQGVGQQYPGQTGGQQYTGQGGDQHQQYMGQGGHTTGQGLGQTTGQGIGQTAVGQSGDQLVYHDYACNIRFERFELGGRPFTIHIFIGDFNPDSRTWMKEKSRVGGIYNFVAGVQRQDGSNCSNCEQQQHDHTIVTGQVSLTTALLDDVEDPNNHLNSLIPEEIIPYLQRNLHWRITDPNGREIPRDRIRTLKISVVECSATVPTNPGEFIQYGDHRVLDIVTEGRPGGKAAQDGF
ncbi:hypothetical protein TWF694_000404 [Orbilia ellipsospora]|uniref:tyrosinase n=1 Tax=Orbilia ellipsospora TaxID=2528407 RepID=A0AAV9XQ93_9PEZI